MVNLKLGLLLLGLIAISQQAFAGYFYYNYSYSYSYPVYPAYYGYYFSYSYPVYNDFYGYNAISALRYDPYARYIIPVNSYAVVYPSNYYYPSYIYPAYYG